MHHSRGLLSGCDPRSWRYRRGGLGCAVHRDDGDADVEYGFAGCCVGATDSRGRTAPPVAMLGGPDCDGCADLDLGKDSLQAGKEFLPAPGMIIARLLLAQSLSGPSESPEVGLHIGNEALIAALSSVILLT